MNNNKIAPASHHIEYNIELSRAVGQKPTLTQAGAAFEALFLQTIMKAMREAKLDEGIFDSDAQKPFESMLDNAYSDKAAKNMKLGLAEAITRQFSSNGRKP